VLKDLEFLALCDGPSDGFLLICIVGNPSCVYHLEMSGMHS